MARGATFNFTIGLLLGITGGVLLSSSVASSARAAAERARLENPFEITADRIDYDGDRDLYVATGNVRVVQPERSLRAHWVAFSAVTRIGVAEGDVELLDAGTRLAAEFMVFDVDTLRGMLFQGVLDAGNEGFRVRARELIRTGENTFTARDAIFSTCRCEPGERLPWQLSSREADVELGEYGTIKNSTLDILGVPVLWIPWAFFPVKSERETGLLLPDLQLGGRGGYGLGIPFFWAAHPQLNVIATQRFMSERGYKQDLEFEYVFGERSEGDLFVAGLRDGYDDPSRAPKEARWSVLWDHDQMLPWELRWQTDLKLASDNVYAEDFDELREFREFRFLESTTNVARSFGRSGAVGGMVGARFADAQEGLLIGSEYDDADDWLLQRLVEGRFDVQPGGAVGPLGLEFRMDSEVIQFGALRHHESTFASKGALSSAGGARFYDTGIDGFFSNADDFGQADGVFEPGEALAERGTRAVLHPRVARAFRVGRFAEVVPEIGWSQTLYATDRQEFSERGLLTGRVDVRGRLARDYSVAGGGSMRHVIEPRVGWAYVSSRRQRNNPLLVPEGTVEQTRLRTLSLESVTRNPSDRIEATNQVVLALGQRFFTREPHGVARLRADLVTAVDWDFSEEGLGDVLVEARLFSLGPFSSRLRGTFDPEAVAISEGEVGLDASRRFDYAFFRELTVGSAYRYLRRVPQFFENNRGESRIATGDREVNQLDLFARVELSARLRLRYATIYSLEGGNQRGMIKNEALVEYVSKCRCWGFGVNIFQERRQGIGAGISFRFLGPGDENRNLFDGGYGMGGDAF